MPTDIPQGSGLGHSFKFFKNSIFRFMEICDLRNYTDNNPHGTINTVNLILYSLMKDTEKVSTFYLLPNTYCSAFCVKTSTKKTKLIRERALRFLLKIQNILFNELLENCN